MSLRWLAMAFLVFAGLSQPAASQTAGDQPPASQAASDEERREQELATAFGEGAKAATKGRADVPLLSQASLHLPPNYMFIPQPQAARIMRALGNTASQSLVGLVFPSSGTQDWFAEIKFIASGYVKDDEAKDWKADALLTDLREGTEEANKDRIERGFAAIEVVGWAEPPAYDVKTHRLVWAATNREKNSADTTLGVNYNTYALGREGFFSLNLLTDADKLPGTRCIRPRCWRRWNTTRARPIRTSTPAPITWRLTASRRSWRGSQRRAGHVRADRRVCRQGREGADRGGYRSAGRAQAAVWRAQDARGLKRPWRSGVRREPRGEFPRLCAYSFQLRRQGGRLRFCRGAAPALRLKRALLVLIS